MRITSLETITLRMHFDRPVTSAMGSAPYFTQVLVKVETDQGVTGYGETWTNYPSWAYLERQATVNEGIRPLLEGRDADDWVRLRESVFKKLERPVSQWGAMSILYQALSGVDQAIWDIRGKSLGRPVCSLLGGAPVKVRAYCSGLGPENVVGDAERYLARGVTAFKLKVGMGPERDRKNILELRKLIGGDCLLMVDANQGWTPEQALGMLEYLEDQNVFWLEEPVDSRDYESMALIRSRTGISIACGENYYGRDFAGAIRAGAADIIQPDVTKCGGITDMTGIAGAARIWSKKWAPHYFGGAIGLAATLQVMGSIPDGLMLEYPHEEGGIRNGILSTKIEVSDGWVEVPSRPGLGVELDQEAIDYYRL